MILRDIIVRQKNKRQSKCRNIYTVKEELWSSLLCSALLWTADCVALHLIISNCRGALRRLQCDVK